MKKKNLRNEKKKLIKKLRDWFNFLDFHKVRWRNKETTKAPRTDMKEQRKRKVDVLCWTFSNNLIGEKKKRTFQTQLKWKRNLKKKKEISSFIKVSLCFPSKSKKSSKKFRLRSRWKIFTTILCSFSFSTSSSPIVVPLTRNHQDWFSLLWCLKTLLRN